MGTISRPGTDAFEWVLQNFGAASHCQSVVFAVGGRAWKLFLTTASTSAAISLRAAVKPGRRFSPNISFTLTIVNHKDAGLNMVTDCSQMLINNLNALQRGLLIQLVDFPISITRAGSGFLTADGALVVRVEYEDELPHVKSPPPLYSELDGKACYSDLLALLDDPGVTSDLTIITGGGSGSGSFEAGRSGEATPGRGGGRMCFFRVHRAILAARCPYFRTLFNAGMADSAARELPLPDADPDAFAVLLQWIYGGEVPACERAAHRAAIVLCDKLLLPNLQRALEKRLVESAGAASIAADLLWAAQGGREELVKELGPVYKRVAQEVDAEAVAAMAAASPQLVAWLLVEVTRGPQQQAKRISPC